MANGGAVGPAAVPRTWRPGSTSGSAGGGAGPGELATCQPRQVCERPQELQHLHLLHHLSKKCRNCIDLCVLAAATFHSVASTPRPSRHPTMTALLQRHGTGTRLGWRGRRATPGPTRTSLSPECLTHLSPNGLSQNGYGTLGQIAQHMSPDAFNIFNNATCRSSIHDVQPTQLVELKIRIQTSVCVNRDH